MTKTLQILKNRLKIVNNHLANIRNHLVIHLVVGLGVMGILVLGGTAFFYLLFHTINDQMEDFGPMLMDKLVGMVMMAFFSMLVFSNLIITLSTTYISREVEYFMSHPVTHTNIFFVKLVESVVYSSWAFAVLAIPFFTSFGMVREVSPWFYLGVVLIITPFLVIPAAIGALITMLLSAFLPARRTLKWSVALVALGVALSIAVVKLTGAGSRLFSENLSDFTQVLQLLRTGNTPWSPHIWITRGILDLGRGDWKGFFYWVAMLSSTALMLLQVCAWLAPPLYYRGWCLARESSTARNGGASLGRRLFDWIERRLGFVGPASRSLIMKDLKTFWRDPSQWSQLIILFGILFIYTANLRNAYFRRAPEMFFGDLWNDVLSLFNMGATCFILSILTTRFIYPMLSLEGKQYWIVGLAPQPRSRVVWEKYALCWVSSLLLTETLMFFSNWVLEVDRDMKILSCFTVFLISFGLTSLSVGMGAATPNFKEDNPARIANGLGGTLNVILSLIYIGLVMALIILPIYLKNTGLVASGGLAAHALPACIAGLVVVQTVTVVLPMRIGLKKWREMEF